MSPRRQRPVVGVPELLTTLPAQTSVGKIWNHGLRALAAVATVRIVRRRRSFVSRPRVDVWLTDGHQGALDVRQPVVAHLHEAAWADPGLRALMEPGFIERYEGPSAEAAIRAARVLTVSESSKRQIIDAYGIAADRVVVAANGVDHTIYRPGLRPPAELLGVEHRSSARPYVLFVSTVHPRKNLTAVRDALAILAAEGREHPLVLVAGAAADRPDSEELLAGAVAPIPGVGIDPVNLRGASDEDVARLMAGAGAFCLPSLMEGFGMAVAEAMACGTPVVVSDRGSLPEVVGDAGIVTGVHAEDVAGGLRSALEPGAARDKMIAAGIERSDRYSWSAMAAGWTTAITEAIEDP